MTGRPTAAVPARTWLPAALWGLLLAPAACGTVDVGPALTDVNACRPDQAFFASDVWPGFLSKTYQGKRCLDSGCHDPGSGRLLVLVQPTSAPGVPLPPDWAAVYKSVTEQLLCTNVSSSPLLTKPDGRQPHGGQKLIEPDGPEATLVKMWVATR